MKRSSILLAGFIASLSLCSTVSFIALPGSADVLKGSVTEQGHLPDPKPGLSRRDIDKDADPFAGPGEAEEAIDAPPSAFKAPPTRKPPKKPFNLQAEDQGNFQGQQQTPMVAPNNMPIDGAPDDIPEQVPQKPLQAMQNYNPNDPDSSPDMQLAWDAWHKRVAATIFERFNFFARAAFRHSPPLLSNLGYVVTRDGHITNLQMSQKSNNVLFNVLVYQSVKSLEGDLSVLQFPQGSRRQFVQKWGTFTQNYGNEGFRYTIGDKETIGRRQ